MFSLSKRKLREDFSQVFKFYKGHDNLQVDIFFTVGRSNFIRNNAFNITGKLLGSHESKLFFFNRVVNAWSNLPCEVVDCNAILTFNNSLDKYLNTNHGLNMFVLK